MASLMLARITPFHSPFFSLLYEHSISDWIYLGLVYVHLFLLAIVLYLSASCGFILYFISMSVRNYTSLQFFWQHFLFMIKCLFLYHFNASFPHLFSLVILHVDEQHDVQNFRWGYISALNNTTQISCSLLKAPLLIVISFP